ncbi:MAG: response regulator [Treponema sp.]|jgi:chemotaxis protein histidine kinase CheA/CheY-like chemotaxis protein|nr:response regulator [Treponema sp.]
MAIDRDKYIGKFIDEGLENVHMVETLLFDIKEDVSVEDDVATLLRSLHTLKGTARMLEFKRIESLSHALESVFIAFKEQRIGLTNNAVKLALASLDMLKTGFGTIQQTKDDNIDVYPYEKELAALAANEDFTVIEPEREKAVRILSGEAPAGAENGEGTTGTAAAPDAGPEAAGEASLPEHNSKKKETVKAESIRISLDKIDAIIRNAASLQSLEITAKSIAMETTGLNELVRNYSRLLKTQKNLNTVFLKEFRKLERLQSRITQLIRNYAIDAGKHTKDAYDSVISLRMLPISTILDTYPRYVYEMSTELGKKIHLVIEGKENEIDKNIIETLQDVFLHMVRNSIDHGIETPEERRAAGKDETGELIISCSRESGNMKIVISDDGKGIDHEGIRKKAVDSGYVTEAAAASLSKEDLIGFIFQSGFSTSQEVSNISGRGVGMDAVRSHIERLKGSITVDTTKGKGTAFTIMVPLSIAALMGFPCTAGGMKFIIPANFVDTILLIKQEEIITVVDRPEIKYQDRIIKLYYLEQILGIQGAAAGKDDGTAFVVIIHVYDDIIALVVDSVSSMRSVILKPVPSFMDTMDVFSGIVLSEDYEMVSALHMPTVIKMAKKIKSIDLKKRDFEYKKHRKAILVVDDSLPTREIESEILRTEGYAVDMAADGADALKAAKNRRYDLICTDLNMPQMDGFMLTDNIRKNEDLSAIPIIVISSRESEEDQKRAAMLGASRYIVKNSFNNHNLLAAVRELIGDANG